MSINKRRSRLSNQARVSLLSLTALSVLVLATREAHALRAKDMSGDDAGAFIVYPFNETTGTAAADALSPALPLKGSNAGNLPTGDGTEIRTNVAFVNGSLIINYKANGIEVDRADQGYQSAQVHRSFLEADAPAMSAAETKLQQLNQCTNGFTVQMFLRPHFPFQGNDSGNMILGLSNSAGRTALARPNIGIYQTGQAGAESITLEVRNGANSSVRQVSVPGAFSSVRENENPGVFTEVIATQEAKNGVLTVYVNRIARSSLTGVTPNFDPTAKLVIGNELVPLSTKADGTAEVNQQRNWSGEIAHIAIYCKGFTRAEILGPVLVNKSRADIVAPRPRESISTNRRDARRLVERLTGVIVPIDHPMVLKVEEKLNQGDRLAAAKVVTGDSSAGEPGHPEFLNTVVKQMALKMSNREETIRVPLNDFAASFIGVTRDDISAQELLTGNFFYMADPRKTNVRNNIYRDLVISNNHYEDLENGLWDIGKVLMKVPGPNNPTGLPDGQQIAIDATGTMSPNPDPAGVLTSRAFMGAHAIAGTNRRMVEYSFRQFMCVPMNEMADTSASPARIGRDVDRIPGGDATKFEMSCKGCHTVMDGFRGAFAKFDFANITVGNQTYNFIRNTQVSKVAEFGFGDKEVDKNGTVYKMNHNFSVFPNGYEIVDDSFVNNAVGAANKSKFGWQGANKLGGVGVGQFGRMIADSDRFAQCMSKRVFEAVCQPGVKTDSQMNVLIDGFASKFKASGYKLRSLFQEVAANPVCAQNMGR